MTAIPPGSHRYHELQKLLQRLHINPVHIDWNLLDQALTHSSFDSQCNYEPLEFVGDGVLRLLAADYLWHHHPHLPVGEYTALRSVLVSNRLLRQMALEYGLGEFALVAPGLPPSGMWLADLLEAVVGAIYLSSGSTNVLQSCFYPAWQREAQRVLQDPARLNYKNALQEWTQEHYKILPTYETESLPGRRISLWHGCISASGCWGWAKERRLRQPNRRQHGRLGGNWSPNRAKTTVWDYARKLPRLTAAAHADNSYWFPSKSTGSGTNALGAV